jgi:hypothetical protein
MPQGPFEPVPPRDPNADTVLDKSERGEDELDNEVLDAELTGSGRPLTDDEKEAAEHDPGLAPRTYAPASERVAKPPAPGEEKLGGVSPDDQPSTGAVTHPGDRSAPEELR